MFTSDTFDLDPRLEADSFHMTTMDGCQIRLMNDARFPWLILVPEVANVSELFDLPHEKSTKVMALAIKLGAEMRQKFGADKINIATIGNVVKQLHIHVVARFETDEAWPGPIWGVGKPIPMTDDEKHKRIHSLHMSLGHMTASPDVL